MKPIRETCIPRREVLKGDLEDAIFAADFGHVVEGRAPDVYQKPAEFFRNTHPSAGLKSIVTTIFGRLADPSDAGAVLRLSTGFGGGKTHTLIALWHLARNIADAALGTDLLPAAGRPHQVVVAGVDAQKFGTKVCGIHDGLETHSLWGELAFQIGGPAGYALVQAEDSPTEVPHESKVRALLPDKPVLILLDELVIYMSQLDQQARKALLSFLGKLITEVAARRQAVLVVTDPSKQFSYQQESAELSEAFQQMAEAAQPLDDVLGRKMSDFDPIGDEAPQVVICRLFERVDRGAADLASAEYYNAYQRIAAEYPELLPPEADVQKYARDIVRCYPFHPRLLETAQDRLGALQDFNKSRGTLRLFARILRDAWESGSDLPLITAGDLDWQSPRIQADLLQRLNRGNFVPAVNADVIRHAGQLDADYGTDAHRRVATALLLESLPLTPSAAMDKAELTLAVLRPSEVGHEPGEAMDRLMSLCWHTYRDDSGRKFQFRYEPNANKIIEERTNDPTIQGDAHQALLTLVQNHYGGHTFFLVAWPSSPKAVRDSAALKLVLCDSEQMAQAVCNYEDNSDPTALRPRAFRNAILALAPTPAALQDAELHMCRRRAAEQVLKERKKGDAVRQQLEELLPTLRRKAHFRAIRAFNRVVFQGRPSVTLDERYLVSEDAPLEKASGQTQLKDFLDANSYIYQPNDAIDIDLLLDLMKGATPSLDHPGAYPASAVHERALSSPKLRLLLNEDPLRNAILRGIGQGKVVVRLPAGDVYDRGGCVTGPAGGRKRESRQLTVLKLSSDVLVSPSSAPCVAGWTRVDEVGITPPKEPLLTMEEAAQRKQTTVAIVLDALDAGQLDALFSSEGVRMVVANERFDNWQPPREGRGGVVALSWDEAIQYAAIRPLIALKLNAVNAAAVDKLLACAQPFGAQTLTLTLKAGGSLKDGGQANFAVSNVRHNSPLQPADIAKRILRATETGGTCQAGLTLDFGGKPVPNVAAKLEQARAQAVEGLTPEAHFGAETADEDK